MSNRYVLPDHKIRLDHIVAAIHAEEKRVGRPLRVLDLGCAESPMQQLDYELYVGVDNDMNAVNLDTFDRAGFCFVCADFEQPLEMPFGEFDLVLWCEGPEHTGNMDAVFDNARQCLAAGGRLMITCPDGEDEHYKKYDHKNTFTLDTLRKLVEEHGFQVLELTRISTHLSGGFQWLYCLAALKRCSWCYIPLTKIEAGMAVPICTNCYRYKQEYEAENGQS